MGQLGRLIHCTATWPISECIENVNSHDTMKGFLTGRVSVRPSGSRDGHQSINLPPLFPLFSLPIPSDKLGFECILCSCFPSG